MPYMCSRSAIFLKSNNTNGEDSRLRNTWQEKKNLCTMPFFLETEVEQFWCPPFVMPQSAETELSTQKTLQGKIASNTIHSFQTFSVHSLRGRQKKGREKSAKGKKEGSWAPSPPSLPNPPPFFPSSLSPTPFDICHAGHNIHRVRYFRRLWKSGADSFQNRFII